MCFSARASFLAAGLLLPMGAAACGMALVPGQEEKRPLALAPLLFALQQACEGVVWLRIHNRAVPPLEGWPPITLLAVLTYLFFAYALWPVWIPWAAVSLLPRPGIGGSPLVRVLPALGLVAAFLLWVPLLLHPQAALPEQIGHSLVYGLPPWTLQLLPPLLGPALYAALIVGPLLLVPSGRVRSFGLTLLLAFVFSAWSSRAALTSVWCFASALLSAQILWILREPNPCASPSSQETANLRSPS